jgi:hypothetical protein
VQPHHSGRFVLVGHGQACARRWRLSFVGRVPEPEAGGDPAKRTSRLILKLLLHSGRRSESNSIKARRRGNLEPAANLIEARGLRAPRPCVVELGGLRAQGSGLSGRSHAATDCRLPGAHSDQRATIVAASRRQLQLGGLSGGGARPCLRYAERDALPGSPGAAQRCTEAAAEGSGG